MPSSFNPARGASSPSLPVWTYVAGGSTTPAAGKFTFDGIDTLYFNVAAKDGATILGLMALPIPVGLVLTGATGSNLFVSTSNGGGGNTVHFTGSLNGSGLSSGDYSLDFWYQVPSIAQVLNQGGTDAGGLGIQSLNDPTGAQDAATKNYVDTTAQDAAVVAAVAAVKADATVLAAIISAAGISPATGVPTNATAGIVDAAT